MTDESNVSTTDAATDKGDKCTKPSFIHTLTAICSNTSKTAKIKNVMAYDTSVTTSSKCQCAAECRVQFQSYKPYIVATPEVTITN